MVILVSSKNEDDPIKIEGVRVATIQNIDFSNTKWAANSAVRGQIWPKFELIRCIVVILVTCKNEEDPLKNKDAIVATTQNIDFSNTQGRIIPQSEVGSGRNSNSSKILWMSLLLPRIKKIGNKNEGARVATTINIDFSHSQAKNKILFVCPLPTYSPKMGPTQKILLPFFAFIYFFFFFFFFFFYYFIFFLMFLSEDKLFSLESNVFSFKP